MNPATSNNDYNYETAGFDGFLSRSIDNVPQENLDSPAPNSNQIRFDSSQLSGFVGNAIQTPDININSSDGETVLNGKLSVYDDQGNQSIFKGAAYQKLFYGYLDYDPTVLAANGYVVVNFAHGLSKAPYVVGNVRTIATGDKSRFVWRPMPFMLRANTNYFGIPPYSGSIVVDYVDDILISCRIDINDIAGLSFFNASNHLKVVFYCYLNPQA